MQLELGAAENTKIGNYRPEEIETALRLSSESATKLSLAFSERHLPCLLHILSEIPSLAAEDAPSLLKLCQEKDTRSRPTSTNFFDEISQHLVYEILDPVLTNWVPDLVCIFPNRKSSQPLRDVGRTSLAWDKYLARLAQGQRSVLVLTIDTTAPSRY